MAIEPEVVSPDRHPRWNRLRQNGFAALALAVGIVGLLVVCVRQLAIGGFDAPPLLLSVPFAGLAGALAIAAIAAGQRRWWWLLGGVGAGLGAVFLGWFLVVLAVITAVYILLQLVG